MTRQYKDERRWANTDPSLHANHSEPKVRVPSWRGAYIWCLKYQDYDSAELIASRNMVSDECSDGDCSECHFSWCTCVHHSAVQFTLEHPKIKSLAEVEASREEVEAA